MPAVAKPNQESWSKIHFHFKNCISCSKDSSEGEGALSRVLQYGSHFDFFQYVTCVPLGPPAVGVENYENGRGGQGGLDSKPNQTIQTDNRTSCSSQPMHGWNSIPDRNQQVIKWKEEFDDQTCDALSHCFVMKATEKCYSASNASKQWTFSRAMETLFA